MQINFCFTLPQRSGIIAVQDLRHQLERGGEQQWGKSENTSADAATKKRYLQAAVWAAVI